MSQAVKILSPIRLRNVDPDFHESLDKDKTREKTFRLCERIGELQELLNANARQALLIVLQGMDTSGKDAVRQLAVSLRAACEGEAASLFLRTEPAMAN